jgi:hypothetical protein
VKGHGIFEKIDLLALAFQSFLTRRQTELAKWVILKEKCFSRSFVQFDRKYPRQKVFAAYRHFKKRPINRNACFHPDCGENVVIYPNLVPASEAHIRGDMQSSFLGALLLAKLISDYNCNPYG